MDNRNILIIGPPDSGKKTAVKHMHGEDLEIKSFAYGRAIINNKKNYLFSSTGKEGFKSLEDVLMNDGTGTTGIIIVLDSARGITETDNEIIGLVSEKNIPYVLFSNKQDLNGTGLRTDITDAIVIPTIAAEGIGIQDGLKILLKQIERKNKHIDVKKSEYQYQKIYKSKRLSNGAANAIKVYKNDLKSGKSEICKLKLIMHPIELDNVKEILEKRGFSNLTLTEIKCSEDQVNSMETYRASQYSVTLKPKVELSMIIAKKDAEYVIKAIESIKTDDIEDDMFIYPIERILRIRTSEEGEEAID
ncbi:P-II family nitrogen regulator [Methanobacterium paludis]|uniref:Nitrogen regulatory protein P-II n=1 Tax=Methanobacterium paludis (strain DSM 25820 / JCM 18151 / SWAN1) TaxID=868131 RepID=F6D4E8_METPW|nr:P-II family nitrogen regulator [Methanobacterium paludis]AEG18811.1 nitrogen regulatory protein P-II [Methanobacterium paludis]